jgi:hypothetical protein
MKLVHFALLCAGALSDKVTLLPPVDGKSGDPAAWIVLPGAFIDDSTYKPMAEAVQQACSMPLWVAVLGTSLTPSPIPGEIGPRIDYVLNTMKDQGLDLDKVKLFYGGHSLGSVFIQDHLQQYHGSTGPMGGSIEVLGQVLMGGFIQRKYAYPDFSYPVSTLTVGGELDGLARPTRLAEAYFHAKDRSDDFPVVILKGVTHNQFASGDPVTLVKARDLQPEVSYDEAYAAIASVVAPYFERRAGEGGDSAQLKQAQEYTDGFVAPIIDAYQQEGARWMGTPAQFGGPLESDCHTDNDNGVCPQSSSPWAPKAQEIISGGIDDWKLQISNNYAKLSSTPLDGGAFHLPEITNDTSSRTISITTYSQNYWDDAQPSWFAWKSIFDKFDTGFVSTSSAEIATKLASRQCTYIFGAGKADTGFDVDDPNFCAQANQAAYEWALQRADPETRARFEQYGQKYVFGDDVPKQGGPLWLYAHVGYDEETDASGEKVIKVSSPMQKTEVDYWKNHFGPIPRPSAIPDPGCYHYCKILSPARAMEWIYVDSLRLKRSISGGDASQVMV